MQPLGEIERLIPGVSAERVRHHNTGSSFEQIRAYRKGIYLSSATNSPIEERSMTKVATQPASFKGNGRVNRPMILGFAEIIMVTIIRGTATIPLKTADQKSARMGSIPTKLRPRPMNVAITRTA